MLFGEKLKGLHKGIDEMVEAVETDRMAGGGGEAGPEKVVRRLKVRSRFARSVDSKDRGRFELMMVSRRR